MIDPLVLAVVFLENLVAKITNIHRRYFGYLYNYIFSKKRELQSPNPDMISNHSFKIVQNKNYILNKVNTPMTDL